MAHINFQGQELLVAFRTVFIARKIEDAECVGEGLSKALIGTPFSDIEE